MRNFFKNIKNTVKAKFTAVREAVCRKIRSACAAVNAVAYRFAVRSNTMFAANCAEDFVDSGIKILIAVVIGALLLGGLYALFGDTIMPTVTQKVKVRPDRALCKAV